MIEVRELTTRANLITRLRAAAVTIDGRLYVRAAEAMRILRVGLGHRWRFQRDGRVTPLRVPCRPRQGASLGIECYWPAAQVALIWWRRHRQRAHRPWSSAEDDYLLEHAGLEPLPGVARHLGRSSGACQARLYALGMTVRSNQGLLSTGEVARLCRRARTSVQNWIARGLRCRRINTTRGDHLIDRKDLVAFLRNEPDILAGIDPFTRRKLGLSVFDLQEDAA